MIRKSKSPVNAEKLWKLSQQLQDVDTGDSAYLGVGLKAQALELIDLLRAAMWPEVFGFGKAIREPSGVVVADRLEQASALLLTILAEVDPGRKAPEETVEAYFASLPDIKALLATDVQAAYEGDPAARNNTEIMLAYPAFEAISIFRLAHRLFELEVPLLPRMMTEHAHRITGVDIHPGATIGSHFFIDHATGVVIGETTTIGHHVKLYQGVTLGAKSFPLDENGNPIKGIKRHPDIGNYVVIYSGATILGGDTRIGDGAVIGGNVWLTHSVDAGGHVIAVAEERRS